MSNAIQILIERATEKADGLAKELAKAREQLNQAKQKLAMLEGYQTEIAQAASQRSLEGVTGFFLQNQNAYSAKIDLAVKQQAQEITFIENSEQHYLQSWKAALAEQKKFEALQTREKLRLEAKLAKQEQKNNDEYAARIYRTRTVGESS